MGTFHIETFGCKSNQYDAQLWRRLFVDSGWSEAEVSPEVYLINTCTVTASADRQAKQTVRRIRRQQPSCTIVVAGCGPVAWPEAYSRMPEVDLAVGRYGPNSAAELTRFLDLQRTGSIDSIKVFSGHCRAFLKIQDGCSHSCAYCIVPQARGASRSRDLAEVVAEARGLLNSGHREIILTGIRMGDYRPSLPLVLSALAGLPGLLRLRLSSLEPDDVSDELVEAIGRHQIVARHLHLPLQSGSDRILAAMGRPYGIEQYREILKRISIKIPNMSFGTDLMVGFPGETEEDFRASLEAARDLPISHLHIFSYSRRPGTRAADMPGQIPQALKRERSHRLREAFRKKQESYWGSLVGRREDVLFESKQDGLWSGLGEHYFRVFVESDLDLFNRMATVQLTSLCDNGMTGEILS